MNTFSQAEAFFLISAVGFVMLWILAAVFLFYLIRATKTFYRIMDKVDKGLHEVGDVTREMLEDLKENIIWNFLFRKRKGRRREEKGKNGKK